MVSIQNSISELERSFQRQAAIKECYLQAIKSAAQYMVELDEPTTGPHRRQLTELAEQVAAGGEETIIGSRATLRGLLRDYRDKAALYLQNLRDELARTVNSLQETLDALAQSAGDHESQLRKSVVVLRDVAQEDDVEKLRADVRGAADSIETSLEQIHKDHQLTVAQFLSEIRVLHQRIDAMEAASSIDNMTGLYDRSEIEDRIRCARAGSFHLLLFQVRGINRAGSQYGETVLEELSASFTKRLTNSLPETAIVGRWSAEEFIALIPQPRDPKSSMARTAADKLSGSYVCVHSGKTIRPGLQVAVGIVDSVSREAADRVLDRVKMFLTGGN